MKKRTSGRKHNPQLLDLSKTWQRSTRRPSRVDQMVQSTKPDVALSQETASNRVAPAVTTDKADYAPGKTALISASGFTPGATITFQIVDDPNDPGDDGDVDTYEPIVVADGADGVLDGAVTTTWLVPTTDDGGKSGPADALNATLLLTVTDSKGRKACTTLTDSEPAAIAVTDATVTHDETTGEQNKTATPTPTEDADDNDINLSKLPDAFSKQLPNDETPIGAALSGYDGANNGLDLITIENGGQVSGLTFVLGTSNDSGLRTLSGDKVFLITDPDPRIVFGRTSTGTNIVAFYLEETKDANGTITGAKVWSVQYQPLKHGDSSNPDDAVTLAPGSLAIAGSSSVVPLNLAGAPSGQNLFLTIGTPNVAVVATGMKPADQSSTGSIVGGDTVNTSQAAGTTTIGINNQMIDPIIKKGGVTTKAEGLFFTYVKGAEPDFTVGTSANSLTQTEADVEDNIRFSGLYSATTASFAVVQLQGGTSAVLKLTAFNVASADSIQRKNFIGSSGLNGTDKTEITGVTVLDASGNPVSDVTIKVESGVAVISGVKAGYRIRYTTDAPSTRGSIETHNRLLIENDGSGSGKESASFDVGGIQLETVNQLPPIDISQKLRFEDDGPTAVNDGPFGVTEDDTTTAVSGTVTQNDSSGADTPLTFVSWDGATGDDLSAYGTLVQDPTTGFWSFTLDNTLAATQALTENDVKTADYSYTIKDADGDTSQATLTVTVKGAQDSATVETPSASGPDDKVYEAGLLGGSDTQPSDRDIAINSFKVSATGGIKELVIGGTTFTLAQLQALNEAPQTVDTGEGELKLTGYIGTATGGTVNYTYTLKAAIDNDSKLGATGTEFDDGVTITVKGVSGTTASDDLLIQIVDDVPSISVSTVGAVDTLTVDDTTLETSATTNFADNFSNTPLPGADGATVASTYTLAAVAGNSGLIDTLSGENVVLILNNGVVEGRTATGNALVFTVSVNNVSSSADFGKVTLTQSRAVKHDDPTDPDEPEPSAATLSAANLVTLTRTDTITDADGDTDTDFKTLELGKSLLFKDDGPTGFNVGNLVGFSNSTTPQVGQWSLAPGADGVGDIAILALDQNGVASDGIQFKITYYDETFAYATVSSFAETGLSSNVWKGTLTGDFDKNSSTAPTSVDFTLTLLTNGTYTVQLAKPIESISIVSTSTGKLSAGGPDISQTLTYAGTTASINFFGVRGDTSANEALTASLTGTPDYTEAEIEARSAPGSGGNTTGGPGTGGNGTFGFITANTEMNVSTSGIGVENNNFDGSGAGVQPTDESFIVNPGFAFKSFSVVIDNSLGGYNAASESLFYRIIYVNGTTSGELKKVLATDLVGGAGGTQVWNYSDTSDIDSIQLVMAEGSVKINSISFASSSAFDAPDVSMAFNATAADGDGDSASDAFVVDLQGAPASSPPVYSYTPTSGADVFNVQYATPSAYNIKAGFGADDLIHAGSVNPAYVDIVYDPVTDDTTVKIGASSTSFSAVIVNDYEFTSSQLRFFVAPIVIDLGPAGIDYVAASQGTEVELSGYAFSMAWMGSNDGLLAYDYNQDGLISDIREYAFTLWAPGVETDMQALALVFDTNNDGIFNQRDDDWGDFGIWQDLNSDGVQQSGEFKDLASWGVQSIALGYNSDSQANLAAGGDVQVYGQMAVAYQDGSIGVAEDVAFAAQGVPTPTQSSESEEGFSVAEQDSLATPATACSPEPAPVVDLITGGEDGLPLACGVFSAMLRDALIDPDAVRDLLPDPDGLAVSIREAIVEDAWCVGIAAASTALEVLGEAGLVGDDPADCTFSFERTPVRWLPPLQGAPASLLI